MDDLDLDIPGMDTTTLGEAGVDMIVRKPNSPDPYVNPKGQGDPMALKLLGMDSAIYRKTSRTQTRRILMAQAQAAASGLIWEMTFEQEEADAIELLVAITVGWSGVYNTAGAAVAFSKAAVAAMYRKFPTIMRQADRFAGTIANFIKAS